MPITRLSDLADPETCPSLVIKVGSSLLVGPEGPRREWIAALVSEIVTARLRGQHIILVSSGAIALGAARLGLAKGGRASLSQAQAAAAVGQIALSGLWAELLGDFGLPAAQLLVTLDDLEDRRRYLNATATLGCLLEAGAVPVINENDSVATQEIRFGDNDRLAARVAQAAQASAVLLLSDVDGLFDRDPADPAARLVREVNGITDEIKAMASTASGSGLGSGGMTSKLQAVEIADLAGIALAIVNGRPFKPIAHAIENDTGTLFMPSGSRRRRGGARKSWLGGRIKVKGYLAVDAGAEDALGNGNSLLAAGITAVDGVFERGDPIGIRAPGGAIIAHGLCEYDAQECARLMGHHSSEHEALLGYAPRSAVVHRNQLALK